MADIILEATSEELNYSAGVTGPIQEQINSIENALANVESAFVASRDYSIGEYFIYDTTLYSVTDNVTSGSNFIVGTNVSTISNGFLNSLKDILTFKFVDKILYSTLSTGWTAPKNGVSVFIIEPSNSNNAYAYIEDLTDDIHDVCKISSTSGQTSSCMIPIIKNHTYKIRRSTSNVQSGARVCCIYYSLFV